MGLDGAIGALPEQPTWKPPMEGRKSPARQQRGRGEGKGARSPDPATKERVEPKGAKLLWKRPLFRGAPVGQKGE